jgi:hypothetical protein
VGVFQTNYVDNPHEESTDSTDKYMILIWYVMLQQGVEGQTIEFIPLKLTKCSKTQYKSHFLED